MRTATPLRHLLADDRLWTVGNARLDLDAAIHRTGVHHDRIWLGQLEPLGTQAELPEVGGVIECATFGQAFLLNAQHHDHVGAANPVFDVVKAMRAGEFADRRHEFLRRDESQLAHLENPQRVCCGARHARMCDIADDRDLQRTKAALVLADGERVEQSLRRV